MSPWHSEKRDSNERKPNTGWGHQTAARRGKGEGNKWGQSSNEINQEASWGYHKRTHKGKSEGIMRGQRPNDQDHQYQHHTKVKTDHSNISVSNKDKKKIMIEERKKTPIKKMESSYRTPQAFHHYQEREHGYSKSKKATSSFNVLKSFSKMTWEEKISSQIFEKKDHREICIPDECQGQDTQYWKEKKTKAALFATKQALDFLNRKPSSQEEIGKYPDTMLMLTHNDLSKFFKSLENNLLFDMGWRVSGFNEKDTKHCWCPCSKNMGPWRDQFDLSNIAGRNSSGYCGNSGRGGKAMEPIGLMGHLDSMIDPSNTDVTPDSRVLHYGIQKYLQSLYGDLHGNIGHKGLYKLGDESYKKAEACERKKRAKIMIEYKRKNDEVMRELQLLHIEKKNYEKKLIEISEINKELEEKIKKIEKDKELLKVKGKKESTDVSDKEFEIARQLMRAFFKNLQICKEPSTPPKVVHVRQNLNLLSFFEDNSHSTNDNTYLFRDLVNKKPKPKSGLTDEEILHFHAPKLIADWKIQFENFAKTGKNIKNDKAVDKGGPTREFFSQVWKQMESLHVSVKDAQKELKTVNLFIRCSAGVIPNEDDAFLVHGEEAAMVLKDKATMYYRAIGRIMFRSLSTNHPISSEALPTFYRNVIFRDCGPEEREEDHREDIIDELLEMDMEYDPGWIGLKEDDIFYNESNEIITHDSFFTRIIPKMYVQSRALALSAMREGLTLNGYVDVPSLFRNMSSPMLSLLAFGKTDVTWLDLNRVLNPVYSKAASLKKIQEDFYQNIFLSVLKERERDVVDLTKDDEKTKTKELGFLSIFVNFCTGLHYLPSKEADPNFKINVEFDQSGKLTNDSLPKVHTCTKDIVLPQYAYDNNREVFESKLDYAVNATKGTFGMM